MIRRIVIAALLLVPLAAAAEWFTVTSRTGAPSDISAADAGVFALAQGTGGASAWLVRPDGGVTQVGSGAGNATSAVWFDDACLASTVGTNIVYSPGSCGAASVTLSHNGLVLRRTPSGLFSAVAQDSFVLTNLHLFVATSPMQMSWNDTPAQPFGTVLLPSAASMSTLRLNGVDYVAFNEAAGVRMSLDGGNHSRLSPLVSTSLSMFADQGNPALLLLTDGGQLLLIPDVNQPGTSVSIPGPPGEALRWLSFSMAGGDDAGAGFGLLSTADGGVYSPLPDPSRPAQVWVRRDGLLQAIAGRLDCVDARFCAAFGATEVVAYWNNAAPQLTLPSGVVLREGQTTSVSLPVSDGDHDPVFVQWSSSVPQVTITDTSPLRDGTSVELSSSLAAACGDAGTVQLTVTASDGLAAHTQQRTMQVPVLRSTPPAQPLLTPQNPTVEPRDPPVTFTATSDGGCAPASYVWTLDGMSSSGGSSFVVTPTTAWCSPDGGVHQVQVVAVDAVDASVPATTQISVPAWGAAEAPVFTSPVSQDAGTLAVYGSTATSTHFCNGTPGFPGVELVWTVDAGGVPSIAIFTSPTSLTVDSRDVCEGAVVAASAVQQVVGLPATASAPVDLLVDVVPHVDPFSSATPFSMQNFTYDAQTSTASSDFSVGANCLASRGLAAEVTVSRTDGGPVAPTLTVPIDGPDAGWSMVVPGGCSGGDFTATAVLTQDGGAVGQTDSKQFQTAFLQVALDAVVPTTLPVSCGSGAVGTLTAVVPPGACSGAGWTWQQLSGPPVTLSVDGGEVLVASAAQDYSVAGQTVELTVSADAGSGNGASRTQAVSLVPEPFVGVSATLSTPQPRVEAPVDVAVLLRNTTTCAVDGVLVRVELTDLTGLPGSAALDGAKVDAVAEGSAVLVSGLSLSPGASRRLTLRARPRQLGTPRASARAFLGGFDVSVPEGAPPLASCGCSGEAGGLGLFPLLLWAAWAGAARRRRRST